MELSTRVPWDLPRAPDASRRRVLVTGGAGHIGSVLVAQLLSRGYQVTVLDKLLFGSEAILAHLGHPSFRLVAADVRDREALRDAMAGADAVIHLAAVVGEPACNVDQAQAWSINVDGALIALSTAKDCGVERLVLASTCSNYGVSTPDAMADEDSEVHPLSLYARSKVRAEEIVLGDSAPLTKTVFRFGTICGISPRMRFDLLIGDLARAAVLGEKIQIYAPEAWRPFLHVRDAAAHLISWLDLNETTRVAGRVFNVVGENYRKVQLGELVLRHFPHAVVEMHRTAPDGRDYRVSAERLRRELGWSPRLTVEDAFVETARAVESGAFVNPKSARYTALPDVSRLPLSPEPDMRHRIKQGAP